LVEHIRYQVNLSVKIINKVFSFSSLAGVKKVRVIT